jgi:hypothetical protein
VSIFGNAATHKKDSEINMRGLVSGDHGHTHPGEKKQFEE